MGIYLFILFWLFFRFSTIEIKYLGFIVKMMCFKVYYFVSLSMFYHQYIMCHCIISSTKASSTQYCNWLLIKHHSLNSECTHYKIRVFVHLSIYLSMPSFIISHSFKIYGNPPLYQICWDHKSEQDNESSSPGELDSVVNEHRN